VAECIDRLKSDGHAYEKDGALWFRASALGDEKDRVVVRDNGQTTYIASDIAYHLGKRQRGHEHLLDILGADHHGYVARVRAGLEAMGQPGDSLEVRLVQFAILYRGGEKVQMSTRSGEFVTLRELRAEVGNDAARLFYVLRSNEQHLDFDLELAKSRSNENPVYYIQYAHARVRSVFRQLTEKGPALVGIDEGVAGLHLLRSDHERVLMATLGRFPEVVELAAANRAPQNVVHYLRELAQDFHTWYNAETFLVDDAALRSARLALAEATRIVIANGLRWSASARRSRCKDAARLQAAPRTAQAADARLGLAVDGAGHRPVPSHCSCTCGTRAACRAAEPVATRAAQPASQQAEESCGARAAPESGFDFYTMLPGLEVVVPEEDMRPRAHLRSPRRRHSHARPLLDPGRLVPPLPGCRPPQGGARAAWLQSGIQAVNSTVRPGTACASGRCPTRPRPSTRAVGSPRMASARSQCASATSPAHGPPRAAPRATASPGRRSPPGPAPRVTGRSAGTASPAAGRARVRPRTRPTHRPSPDRARAAAGGRAGHPRSGARHR
jgi:hypothetical protein